MLSQYAQNWLSNLWDEVGIPDRPDFSGWSLDYAREVGAFVAETVNGFREDGIPLDMAMLVKMLDVMDVFSGGA